MIDIKCSNPGCLKIIKYDDYKVALRAIKFEGVRCTHCGSMQNLEYLKIKGTGVVETVHYEYRSKMLRPKQEKFSSCQQCYTFWVSVPGERACPFCHREILNPMTGTRHVPKVETVPCGLASLQRIEFLKEEFFGIQKDVNFIEMITIKDDWNYSPWEINMITKGMETRVGYKKLKQQDKLQEISLIEMKIKIKC